MDKVLKEIIDEIVMKIKAKRGLSEFIKNRAKFEGWLKVEIIDSALRKDCSEVVPEKTLIDITLTHNNLNYALELKTVNTNYTQEGVLKKRRPIKKNIESVIKDINDLKMKEYPKKFVLFIVFPLNLEKDRDNWKKHIDRLKSLVKLNKFDLEFYNGESGVLYLGEVL